MNRRPETNLLIKWPEKNSFWVIVEDITQGYIIHYRVASGVSNIIDSNLFDHIIDQLSSFGCFIDQLSTNYQHKNKRKRYRVFHLTGAPLKILSASWLVNSDT